MGKSTTLAIELVRDFKKKTAKKYGIKKIIIFGSQATGKTREGSDIDVLVVSDDFKKRTDFMSKLSEE